MQRTSISLRADPFLIRLSSGLLKPKNQILGSDIAGRVEAVGKNVKEFKPGDDVFGDISADGWGGFAEYVCARENALALKPANLSFEEAAAVPMAASLPCKVFTTAGQVQPGQKVLINGASGGVGTFAVQLAKAFGAEVTAVCSTRNLDVARSIGADHVIDYTKEDFAKNGKKYDLIFATNGDRSISDYRRALSPKGIYVQTGGSMSANDSSDAPGTMDFQDRQPENGEHGSRETKQKRFGYYARNCLKLAK